MVWLRIDHYEKTQHREKLKGRFSVNDKIDRKVKTDDKCSTNTGSLMDNFDTDIWRVAKGR